MFVKNMYFVNKDIFKKSIKGCGKYSRTVHWIRKAKHLFAMRGLFSTKCMFMFQPTQIANCSVHPQSTMLYFVVIPTRLQLIRNASLVATAVEMLRLAELEIFDLAVI